MTELIVLWIAVGTFTDMACRAYGRSRGVYFSGDFFSAAVGGPLSALILLDIRREAAKRDERMRKLREELRSQPVPPFVPIS